MTYRVSINMIVHLACLLSFLAIITAGTSVALARKRVELKPEGSATEISIINAGKGRTYYALSAGKVAVVPITGPGHLRIITRVRFAGKANDEISYRLLYRIDGGEYHAADFDHVTKSSVARYQNAALGTPGKSRSLSLKIGRGVHALELMLNDPSPEVCARFLFAPQREKPARWIALAPLPPSEPVDLFVGEGTVHCYRFSPQRPLKIVIIGPTVLRLLTRTEHRYDMKGLISYRLQIRENGRVLQTYRLSSKRSETATYKSNPNLVPGKAREVTFKVPRGKHHYEIIPLDDLTLLGEVLFPRKDARLGL